MNYVLMAQDANDRINEWLDKNPFVLGGIAILLGVLIAASGVYTLKTGVARNKLGQEFTGGAAAASGYVRIVFGVAAIGFGVYKAFMG